MIKSGVVEVVLQPGQPGRTGITTATRSPGQDGSGPEFFGEIELVRGGQSIASIRAGPGRTGGTGGPAPGTF